MRSPEAFSSFVGDEILSSVMGRAVSAYFTIFITPAEPVETLIRDVSEACGAILQPQDDEYVNYSVSVCRAAGEVELEHDYEEDHGIDFEKYDALITIRDFDRDEGREEGLTREIFRKLADTGKCSVALVFDLQLLIASAEPPV